MPTSWPTQRLAGLARAQGGGEGAEACVSEGLGHRLHLLGNHHHPPRLLLPCQIGEMTLP